MSAMPRAAASGMTPAVIVALLTLLLGIQPISASMLSDEALITLASVYSASPPSSTGRRP